MEKLSKADLMRVVDEHKDKLTRYESRLRDVVSAYKSLSKEKEALEASFIALTATKSQTQRNVPLETNKAKVTKDTPEAQEGEAKNDEKVENESKKVEGKEKEDHSARDTEESETESGTENVPNETESTIVEQLRLQLATLTNSLSTLSAEKSRMEAGFQADKRKLRQEKEEREQMIRDLQNANKEQEVQHKNELEALKSKLIVERHEREREHNDHGAMIMELQKLTTEERCAKEQLEKSIGDLRTRAAYAAQLEKKLRDVQNEFEAMKTKLRTSEAAAQEASPLLLQLQAEMSQLKQQHTVAIQEEQKRAVNAEERARHLAAVHEERVANLESRLAELSETVGSYDRLRQQDQYAIQKLKEHIAQMDTLTPTATKQPEKDELSVELDPAIKVQTTLKKILELKDELFEANNLCEKPLDIEDVILAHFVDFGNRHTELHAACREEKEKILQELEQAKKSQVQMPLYPTRHREGTESEALKIQVRSLQERVRMLNNQLEQTECAEQEWKVQAQRFQQQLEMEKTSWREKVASLEAELRARAVQTEQQLALQREHSLALLEDKEQEIRTLKSSFQMFLPPSNLLSKGAASSVCQTEPLQLGSEPKEEDSANTLPAEQSVPRSLPGILLGTLNSSSGVGGSASPADSPHILHYAHELARREVDISNSRKARNKLESSLRDMSKILAAERERHSEETLRLREAVARLERCQSREGANLEYLKNVVMSFLESSSPSSKRHMLNAIAAVLRFSDDELDRVSRHSSNSWWYNSQ